MSRAPLAVDRSRKRPKWMASSANATAVHVNVLVATTAISGPACR